MARIRTIKPDAFTSDSLSSVSVLARWTFAGLWTYCDDEGRGRADVRLIKAALYPLDDGVPLSKLSTAIDELRGIGSVCLFEVDGKEYLHCTSWGHQKINRPTRSKIPPCPEHEDGDTGSVHATRTEDSLSAHGGLTSGKEQGTGKGKDAHAADAAREFEAFWDLYPRKADRARAAKAYTKARRTTDAAKILAGLQRQLPWFEAQLKPEGDFRPHASTWLNGERWGDAPVLPMPRAAQRLDLPEAWR